MIDTNLTSCQSELMEVINLFQGAENLKIRHLFTEGENKFVNTVTVDGQTFAYGNFIGKIDDEIVRKRLTKRYAKLSLYKALSKKLNVELPWGALTGIRPTKIPMSLYERKKPYNDDEVYKYLKDIYYVSDEKLTSTKIKR